MTRTSVRSGRAPYAVVVDIEVSPHGRPSWISSRYFAYRAALSEVPRAVSSTKRGSRAAICRATSWIRGAPASRIRRSTSGCSAISRAMIRPGRSSSVRGSGVGADMGPPGDVPVVRVDRGRYGWCVRYEVVRAVRGGACGADLEDRYQHLIGCGQGFVGCAVTHGDVERAAGRRAWARRET